MPKGAVLVVEDQEEIAALEAAIVAWSGANAVVAGDGKSALAILAQHRIDLIILDLNLPHLNGQAVLNHLAQDPRTRIIPVIVVSANLDHFRPTPQVTALLGKPFDVSDLSEAIDGALARRRLLAPSESPTGGY